MCILVRVIDMFVFSSVCLHIYESKTTNQRWKTFLLACFSQFVVDTNLSNTSFTSMCVCPLANKIILCF